MPKLPRTDEYDALIVIPTIANPNTLIPSYIQLLQNLDGYRVHVVASVNPKRSEEGRVSAEEMARIWNEHGDGLAGSDLTIYNSGQPIGFGPAIDVGMLAACGLADKDKAWTTGAKTGLPPVLVIFNDDLRVTRGWLNGLIDAFHQPRIMIHGAAQDANGVKPTVPTADYGRIGLVGPMTNCAAGIQQVSQSQIQLIDRMGLDQFALKHQAEWRQKCDSPIVSTDFLSGYCTAYSADFIEDVSVFDGAGNLVHWFDPRYKVAGFEDNDMCHRAERKGWRAAVVADTFIGHLGHQTFSSEFKEMQCGMKNRMEYYDKYWEGFKSDHRLVGVYRVAFFTPHDLSLFRSSILSATRLLDGISINLTMPIHQICNHPEYAQEVQRGGIQGPDKKLIDRCRANPKKQAKYLREWIAEWDAHGDRLLNHKSRKPDIRCYVWEGEFQERDERNEAIRVAVEELDADWIVSIDHDEWFEDRIRRSHLDRLMNHPNPDVSAWDIGFLTHWHSLDAVNYTRPWGDDGDYTGGMRGPRIIRVNKAAPRKILVGTENGLHCGNVPIAGQMGSRVSGLRMRHAGYYRSQDRKRKEARYNELDPNPNVLLVGGKDYSHITSAESQKITEYMPNNGIGLHMLVYEKEDPDRIATLLDGVYGLVDKIVLVWTGEWDEDDKSWCKQVATSPEGRALLAPRDVGSPFEEWRDTPTGPSKMLAKYAEMYGCIFVHQPLNNHLANARNAGLDALSAYVDEYVEWALFLDPDEMLPNVHCAPAAIRRMAEATDNFGWMFRYKNFYEDGNGSESESVRMVRLRSPVPMRMSDRVHESFRHSLEALSNEGYTGTIRVAPFHCINTGLATSPEELQAKLDRYYELAKLDVQEDPHNPGAWLTIALYWGNERCIATSMECLSRAVACAGKSYLPFQETANMHMRLAQRLFVEAAARMGGHRNRPKIEHIAEEINKIVPELPMLGTVGQRPQVSEVEAMSDLPPFAPPRVAQDAGAPFIP